VMDDRPKLCFGSFVCSCVVLLFFLCSFFFCSLVTLLILCLSPVFLRLFSVFYLYVMLEFWDKTKTGFSSLFPSFCSLCPVPPPLFFCSSSLLCFFFSPSLSALGFSPLFSSSPPSLFFFLQSSVFLSCSPPSKVAFTRVFIGLGDRSAL